MINIEKVPLPSHKQFNNLLADPPLKFNRLTVIDFAGRTTNGSIRYYWRCKCDCGNETVVLEYNIKTGHIKSCGCLQKNPVHISTHNMSKSPEYSAWKGMKRRCYNTKFKEYKNYGKRGIKVCDRWLESFENFYADMGPRPSKGYSIDRVDNDKGYSKENCRWATNKLQSNNKRNTHFLTYNGETKTFSEWGHLFNISASVLYVRILRLKWDACQALTTPVRKQKNHKIFS